MKDCARLLGLAAELGLFDCQQADWFVPRKDENLSCWYLWTSLATDEESS